MGRLRDIAKEAGLSLPKLADRMRDVAGEGLHISEDHLANMLRDLDKGADAWWHGTGEPWWLPLAAALHYEDRDALRADLRLGGPAAREDDFAFDVFPALRPLALGAEDLPAGIPEPIRRAEGPARSMLWVAPPGAGRSLVRAWLARRGWVSVEVQTLAELVDTLPARGRVFASVREPVPVDDLLVEDVPKLPEGVRVLIAVAPMLGPMAHTHDRVTRAMETVSSRQASVTPVEPRDQVWMGPGRPLAVVRTAPWAAWMPQAVQWMAARVAPGGGFDPDTASVQLSALLGDLSEVTWGHVLELAGMLDQAGATVLDDPTGTPGSLALRRIAWCLRGRANRPEVGVQAAAVLRARRGSAAASRLVGAEVARLRAALGRAQPRAVWADLLGHASLAELDADALRQALEAGGPDAAEGALALLRAEGVGLAPAMEAAGLLRREGEALSLHPSFLGTWVREAAVASLGAEGPLGSATLLAHPETVGSAMHALVDALQAGDLSTVHAALGSEGTSVDRMVLLDAVTRAVVYGEVLLPAEDRRALTEAVLAAGSKYYSDLPPVPTVRMATDLAGDPLTSPVAGFLASSMLSMLPPGGRSHLRLLAEDAWAAARAPILRLIDLTMQELRAHPMGPVHVALDHMVAEIRAGSGMLFDARSRSTPAFLVDDLLAAARGEPTSMGAADLALLPMGVGLVEAACARLGQPIEQVLAWCWTHWRPKERGLVRTTHGLPVEGLADEQTRRVWASMPAQAVDDAWARVIVADEQASASVSDAVWRRVAAMLLREPRSVARLSARQKVLFERLPSALVVEALALPDRQPLVRMEVEAIWRHHAGVVWPWVVAQLTEDGGDWRAVREVAVLAPPERLVGIVAVVREAVEARGGLTAVGRHWAAVVVQRQEVGWKEVAGWG